MGSSRQVRGGWRANEDRRQVRRLVASVASLNIAGWGIFLMAILPRHFHYAGLGVGIGVAVTAWTLGARHAFDADHIAAIDNATRKLMSDGKRPLGVGFFFALGHSSIMLMVGTGITIAATTVFHAVVTPDSAFEAAGGIAGTALAAGFLWLIAALNLVVFAGIYRVFRDMRRGVYDEVQLEAHLDARGLMNRVLGRWMNRIKSPSHMFLVGLAFGIGFDTATEVLLLGGTAAAATRGLPWYAVLALPLLFAGGMTLLDTIDGLFMNTAYGWALARPVRKVYYNLTITGLSVAVAFLVGGIEFAGLLSTELHMHGWFGDAMANFDLNTAGYTIVALFVLVWAIALGAWKLGRLESRWAPNGAPPL